MARGRGHVASNHVALVPIRDERPQGRNGLHGVGKVFLLLGTIRETLGRFDDPTVSRVRHEMPNPTAASAGEQA